MPVAIQILSLEFLSSAQGQRRPSGESAPALYAIHSGNWKLSCESDGSGSGQVCLHPGDVAIITQPVSHQLEVAGNSSLADDAAACLKFSFQAASGASELFAQLPTVVTARNICRPEMLSTTASMDFGPAATSISGAGNTWVQVLANLLTGVVLGSHPDLLNSQQRFDLDPEISQTLLLMDREPGKAWTIEKLAAQAGISRSALAQKFKLQVGQTPNEYLLNVRMQLADGFLKGRRHQLKEIARLTGYQSVSAFSTAFKRWSGKSPGAQRKSSS